MPHHSAQPPSPPKPPRCRLALVVIARNEAVTLRACLESARGLVESIILLDTDSSDETVAIAQACGAQVHHFTWCDDVAAARNAALAHSPAAWNLILDADECLAEDAERLRAERCVTPEQAVLEILPVVEQAWLKCLEIGEQSGLEGTVRGRGSFLATQNLAVLYEQLGRLDEAQDDRVRAQVLRQQVNAQLSETSSPGSQR